MFTKRTTAAALFTLVLAFSFIVASGGFVGFAFAAKKGTDKAADTTTNSDSTNSPTSTDKHRPPQEIRARLQIILTAVFLQAI